MTKTYNHKYWYICSILGHKKKIRGILKTDFDLGLPIFQMYCIRCGNELSEELI